MEARNDGKEMNDMTKDTYLYLCNKSEAGEDAFVIHPDTHQEGRVASCVMPSEHLIVETPEGDKRCWDFHECEEITPSHDQVPYR